MDLGRTGNNLTCVYELVCPRKLRKVSLEFQKNLAKRLAKEK